MLTQQVRHFKLKERYSHIKFNPIHESLKSVMAPHGTESRIHQT